MTTKTIDDPVEMLLDQARGELTTVDDTPLLARVHAFAAWRVTLAKPLRRARWVAIIGSLVWVGRFSVGAWMLSLLTGPEAFSAWLWFVLPVMLLLGSVRLASRSTYAAQVWARVLLLGVCMLGASAGVFQNATFDSQLGLVLRDAVASTLVPAAILMGALLGTHGLTTPRRAHRTGFDMMLSLSLVMGLADVLFMVFVSVTTWAVVPSGPAPFVVAAVLAVGAVGLFRGRVWGLLLMAAGNVAEVILIVHGGLLGSALVTSMAGVVLMLTATVQVLLPGPVYLAMFVPSPRIVAKLRSIDLRFARVLAAVVAGLLGISAAGSVAMSRGLGEVVSLVP